MPANRSRRGRKRNSQNMNIKLEAAELSTSEEETPTNIQKYLNSFNKEIQIVSDTSSQSSSSKSVQNRNETATETCFVTTTGEFFPRNNIELSEGRIVTVIEGDNEVSANGNATDGSMGKKMITTITESSQLLLSDATYQTLTVVPSETETGELSYVLIVQNPEDEPVKKLKKECKEEEKDDDNDEQDLTVYDFDENEATNEAIESCEEEVKKKPGRPPSARKSQNVSQAHMCNYCNYTTSKRYLLSRHLKCHSEERPHKCSVCERGFKTVTALQNHVNTHTGTKPHACKCCDSRFTTSGELVRHVRYKHTHEKPHKCTMCDYASVELSKMRNHMRCHTGERPYQCPHCTYASPDSFKLKRHLRIHTGERPYVCLVCGHRFTQSNSLKAHSLVHCDSDKPIFRCDMCPATCGRKTDLRIHMQKLHTPDQLLTCRRCGKQFPDRYTFKVHIKSHDGEKCWKCEYCPYASVSHRHLISHMLVHTDQKPYSCNLCEQKFRQRQLLKRHQNLYHNPGYVPPVPKEKTHECSECKRSFRHKGNLIRHMSVHDPDSKLVQHATALKLGRQRKISVSNNPNLKILLNAADADDIKDEDDNSEETVVVSKNDLAKSLMSIEADDGQQYVVLEVIPYSGDNAQEDDEDDDNIITTEEKLDMEGEYIVPDTKINFTDKQDNRLAVDCSQISNKEKLNVISDLENCFGFGESDEEVDD